MPLRGGWGRQQASISSSLCSWQIFNFRSHLPGFFACFPSLTGTGQDEAYLHPSLDKLEEEIIVAYASKGSKLSYRFPMDHIVPDIERCLTDPQYAPIFKPVPAWHFPGWPR
jgi:hypothetical protein